MDILKHYKKKTIIFSCIGGCLFLIGLGMIVASLIITAVHYDNLTKNIYEWNFIFIIWGMIFGFSALPFLILGLTVFLRKYQNYLTWLEIEDK